MPTAMQADGSSRESKTLADKLSGYSDLIRGVLRELLHREPIVKPFYGMMAYHMGWLDQDFKPRDARAGKNLRPSLCCLLGEALGAQPAHLAYFAAGIELLHNFSLIHDDIEDRSSTRRGRPTVWSLWGDAQAINAGDGLFSLAHVAWLQAELARTDPPAFLAIVQALEATVLQLCEGQFLDMRGEGSLDLTIELYLQMIGRKTAALIGQSAWVGARAAGAPRDMLTAAHKFGYELGLAFQIRDDMLGIWGNEEETGKSASTDIATRKMTLPIIAALELGSPTVRDELRACYSTAQDDGDETRIRHLLDQAGARQTTLNHEQRHWDAAMDALGSLSPADEWRQHLEEFARSFVGRRS